MMPVISNNVTTIDQKHSSEDISNKSVPTSMAKSEAKHNNDASFSYVSDLKFRVPNKASFCKFAILINKMNVFNELVSLFLL